MVMAPKCGLRSFTIPDNITTLKEASLVYVSTLKNLNIGSSLVTIERDAFRKLTTVSVDSNNPNLIADDRAIFSADGKIIIKYFYDSSSSYTVPDGVTKVEQYCFYAVNVLQSVILPDGLIEIGERAFYESKISSINIPDSVTTYGYGAFQYGKLTSFVFSSNVTNLGSNVLAGVTTLTNVEFYNTTIPTGTCVGCTSLKMVTIGSNVTSVGTLSFNNCKALESIEFQGTTPPTFERANAFLNTNSTFKIYVPDSAVSAYKTAQYFSQYASQIYPVSSRP